MMTDFHTNVYFHVSSQTFAKGVKGTVFRATPDSNRFNECLIDCAVLGTGIHRPVHAAERVKQQICTQMCFIQKEYNGFVYQIELKFQVT